MASTTSDAPPSSALHTEPSRLTVRDLDVAYRRKGSGEPVLYLHGIGMTRRWLPLHERLSQGCDLVAPEHPGFGDTPRPDWLEGFDDLVLHYADLADALGWPTFHLVGYDLGGWLAAELAVFYPERLRSLTLVAPMGLRVRGEIGADRFRMDAERTAAVLFNDRPEDYREYLVDGDEQETMFRSYAEATAAALLAWNPRYDRKLDRRLARVGCPALVVAAESDRVVPAAHAERWRELLPDGELVTVPGTAHALVAQEPDAVAHAIAKNVARGARVA